MISSNWSNLNFQAKIICISKVLFTWDTLYVCIMTRLFGYSVQIITEKEKKVESIFGFEKSPRNCHSSMANKRKIEKKKVAKKSNLLSKKFFFNSDERQKVGTAFLLKKERKQADYNHSFIQNLFTINPNTSVAKV